MLSIDLTLDNKGGNMKELESIREETIKEKKFKLVRLVTELEREMRMLENKIEEIKTIIYHL